MSDLPINDLVRKYIKLRDKRASIVDGIKPVVAQIDEVMATVEATILQHFQATGMESVRTANGTAYKSTRTSAKVRDWDALITFIKEEEAWEFLDKRVNKTAVQEFREANSDLPPGVDWSEELTINIRRS